jgi:phosphoribosylformylglycinamidine cyclo-ligase
MLPEGLQAVIDYSSWPHPPLYGWLQEKGGIDPREMYRVFNMGIGMVAVINASDWDTVQAAVGEPVWRIGKLNCGKKSEVILR